MTFNNMNNTMKIIVLSVMVGMVSSCGEGDQKEKNTATGSITLDTVRVFILKTDTLKKVVELPGELIPYEQTDLYAKVSGFVKEMKVDIGDRVHKGETLAIIEAPEVNTRVAAATSSVLASRSKWIASKDNYERLLRASQTNSPGIVAPVDLERTLNQMLADSASYEETRQQAKAYQEVSGYLFIKAPYDGVIIARKSDPGALVGTDAMLLSVQNNKTLRLRVAVPEMYVALANTLHEVEFNVDAYPEKRFNGLLTRKTETIDPATRTELWEFKVDNDKHLLKAGVFAAVKINMERSVSSFIIPNSAIATTLERKFVIKVTKGKAEWVDVKQGISTDSGIEIFGQLNAGDTLLAKGTDEQKPGSVAIWKVR